MYESLILKYNKMANYIGAKDCTDQFRLSSMMGNSRMSVP